MHDQQNINKGRTVFARKIPNIKVNKFATQNIKS